MTIPLNQVSQWSKGPFLAISNNQFSILVLIELSMAFGIVECSNLFRTLSSLGFYSRTVPKVTSYLTASLFLNILCFREGWSMAGSGRRLQKDTPIEGLHVHPWKLYNLKLSFQAQRWPQFLTVANLWVCSTSCLASRYFLQQYNNLSMLNSLYSKVLDFFPFSRLDFIQNQFYLLLILDLPGEK